MKFILVILAFTASSFVIAQSKVDRITSKCKDRVLMHLKENTDASVIPNAVVSISQLNTTLSDITDENGVYNVVGQYNAVISISSEQLDGNIEQSVSGKFDAVVKEMLDDYVVSEFEPKKSKL